MTASKDDYKNEMQAYQEQLDEIENRIQRKNVRDNDTLGAYEHLKNIVALLKKLAEEKHLLDMYPIK